MHMIYQSVEGLKGPIYLEIRIWAVRNAELETEGLQRLLELCILFSLLATFPQSKRVWAFQFAFLAVKNI